MRRGKHQIITWGWLADYPDAENFLFLLYGPNAKSVHDGENAANYVNEEYDRLYSQLRFMDDGPAKQAVIDRMVRILQEDAPWSWATSPMRRAPITAGCITANPASWFETRSVLPPGHANRVRSLQDWNQPCTGRLPFFVCPSWA